MDSRVPPKQPKLFLRAHLPNQQRTSVQVVAGMRLRDALFKALQRRNLTFDMCEIYQSDTDIPIPWETDISSLNCDEISVRILDIVGFPTYISHQFIRKTFFSLAFCECCRRLLFTGFYCNQCNYRFHQRCADKGLLIQLILAWSFIDFDYFWIVPPLCSKLQMDTYYQMLLANTDSSNTSHRWAVQYYPTLTPTNIFHLQSSKNLKLWESIKLGSECLRQQRSQTIARWRSEDFGEC